MKVVEKEVVAQLESIAETDKAQFEFQEGIQIEKSALRVAALLKRGIQYLLVLDLAKAYDSVLKLLLIEKKRTVVPENFVSKLKVFITTVVEKVSGDITNTPTIMRRSLIQGGTSSPPLFKVFINDLPEKLRRVLKEKFQTKK